MSFVDSCCERQVLDSADISVNKRNHFPALTGTISFATIKVYHTGLIIIQMCRLLTSEIHFLKF